MSKSIITYQAFFLAGFVLFSFLGVWSVIDNDTYLDIAFKILRYTFLLLFYISATQKVNTLYIISLGLFTMSSAYFSSNPSSVEAIALLGFSRLPLIKILLSEMKKEYWKTFIKVFSLFFGALVLILFLMFKNSLFYYFSVFSGIALAVLISLSFSIMLVNNDRRGHIEMFIGMFLFVFTDAVFGIQKIGTTNYIYLLVAALLYNLANYLVTVSIIKKDN